MRLTPHQRAAVTHPGHTLVNACPGSGKTRAIIAKLLESVDDVRDTPRRVACITYTNAAVHEIDRRIRQYGGTDDDEYCEVATIHAFCQNNILASFHWRLPEYADGYTILPSDSDVFAVYTAQIAEKYQLSQFDRQQFESLNRAPSGEPIGGSIPPAAVREFWDLLHRDGYIDFCNIVYASYRILADDPSIARGIACRYKYLLLDEFQDTSALQVEILKLINSHQLTSFFLVGDPEQSIYSFAGADRDLMFEFAADIGATEFHLPGNFRSSSHIVRCAESLIPRPVPMAAVGEAAQFPECPFHEDSESVFAAVTDFFLPMVEAAGIPWGKCAILAPNWRLLRGLGRQLREYGVPVVGPGARPYRRSHLFARFAEEVCAYIENPRPEAIHAIEKELFLLISAVLGKPNPRVFSYNGRRVVFRLLQVATDLQGTHESARDWLYAAADAFSSILQAEGFVPRDCERLMNESVSAMIDDMERAEVDMANLALSDLGIYANPEGNVKLLSIHQSKGREFAAVAIFGLQDGILPYHNKYNPLTEAGEAEARRQLYVAITRAERLLAFFTDTEDWRPLCRFLPPLTLPSAPRTLV